MPIAGQNMTLYISHKRVYFALSAWPAFWKGIKPRDDDTPPGCGVNMVIGKGSCRDIIFSSYFFLPKIKPQSRQINPQTFAQTAPTIRHKVASHLLGFSLSPNEKGEWKNICIWQSGQREQQMEMGMENPADYWREQAGTIPVFCARLVD